MVGTRKRPLSLQKPRKNLVFDEIEQEPSNRDGDQGKIKTKRAKMGKRGKSSPRKKAKKSGKDAKGKDTARPPVKVIFQEDNNLVELEVEGGRVQKEFPMEPEEPRASNNNATISDRARMDHRENATLQRKEVQENKKSRADKFREMVSSASASSDLDREIDSSAEEGETQSSENSDSEDSELGSSSVKILPRSAEDIAREEEEMAEARDHIISQAVDKTMEKIMNFMKENGVVFMQTGNEQPGTPGKKDKGKGKNKSGKSEGVNKSNNGRQVTRTEGLNKVSGEEKASQSETTIYDNAIQQEGVERFDKHIINRQDNNKNRISTSSEELADTSDEIMDATFNLENLDLVLDRA